MYYGLEAVVMSISKSRSTGFFKGLYWTAMVMTLSCIALVLSGNTDWGYGFEHTRIPLSWVLGGIAIFAFVVAELCHPAVTETAGEEEDGISIPIRECEVIQA